MSYSTTASSGSLVTALNEFVSILTSPLSVEGTVTPRKLDALHVALMSTLSTHYASLSSSATARLLRFSVVPNNGEVRSPKPIRDAARKVGMGLLEVEGWVTRLLRTVGSSELVFRIDVDRIVAQADGNAPRVLWPQAAVAVASNEEAPQQRRSRIPRASPTPLNQSTSLRPTSSSALLFAPAERTPRTPAQTRGEYGGAFARAQAHPYAFDEDDESESVEEDVPLHWLSNMNEILDEFPQAPPSYPSTRSAPALAFRPPPPPAEPVRQHVHAREPRLYEPRGVHQQPFIQRHEAPFEQYPHEEDVSGPRFGSVNCTDKEKEDQLFALYRTLSLNMSQLSLASSLASATTSSGGTLSSIPSAGSYHDSSSASDSTRSSTPTSPASSRHLAPVPVAATVAPVVAVEIVENAPDEDGYYHFDDLDLSPAEFEDKALRAMMQYAKSASSLQQHQQEGGEADLPESSRVVMEYECGKVGVLGGGVMLGARKPANFAVRV